MTQFLFFARGSIRGAPHVSCDAIENPPDFVSSPVVAIELDRAIRIGTSLAASEGQEFVFMSLVRLLGYTTLACGCLTGKYREVATNREVVYVEEKGGACPHPLQI